MKLKYYLRGLGLGILVTAALFLAGDKPKQTLTEAEIIEKAKALGMIESPVLSKLNETEETLEEPETVTENEAETVAESETETVVGSETVSESEIETVVESEIETVTEGETETETVAESETEMVSEPETETETETETESLAEPEDAGEEIIVAVHSGEGSGTVSRRMEELGLVEDANEFDKFLMKNGYDKRISVGNHTMKKGMSWDEMGKVLCSRAK